MPLQPMRLAIRLFGEDVDMRTYSSLKLEDLMLKLSDISTIPIKRLIVKAIDETKIRRLDIWYRSQSKRKQTLKDLEILDRTPLMIESKEDDEVEAEEQAEQTVEVEQEGEEQPKEAETMIDESSNIRSCIVNLEESPDQFERF